MNDCHIHISIENNIGKNYSFDEFLQDSKKFAIKKSLVMLHPLIERLYGKDPHFIKLKSSGKNELEYYCDECNTVIYKGTDPFHIDNIKLLELCKEHKNIFPFVYLSMAQSTINNEINFFEENYKDKFYGIKLHPTMCQTKMNDIDIKSTMPILVHCGANNVDSGENVLAYAKNHSNNICLAHIARFNKKCLEAIGKSNNLWIDISPTYYLQQVANKELSKTFINEYSNFDRIKDLFKMLLDTVGEDKIIFGSDVPFGSFNQISNLIEELNLRDKTYKKVFETNFCNFLNIKGEENEK